MFCPNQLTNKMESDMGVSWDEPSTQEVNGRSDADGVKFRPDATDSKM